MKKISMTLLTKTRLPHPLDTVEMRQTVTTTVTVTTVTTSTVTTVMTFATLPHHHTCHTAIVMKQPNRQMETTRQQAA